MKKRILVGLSAAALSLSLLAGALTHLSTRKDIAEVKADGAYCCINDYNLVDHLGEPYTPDGGSGTITLSHDATNSVYTLALDNFVYTGAGVQRNNTYGAFSQTDNSNVVLYISGLNKPVKVTLKGESSIVLDRSTSGVPGFKTIYSTDALDFQTAEGESEKAVFTVGLETDYTGVNTKYYAFACKNSVTVANCEIDTNMNSTSVFSIGFQVANDLTINEGAKLDLIAGIGGGTQSDQNNTTAALRVDGTFTVNAGIVKCKGGTVSSGQGYNPTRAYGAWLNNVVINGGDVSFESGDVTDEWGGNVAGAETSDFTMNGGRFVSRAVSTNANGKFYAYGMKSRLNYLDLKMNDCVSFEASANAPQAGIQSAIDSYKLSNKIEGYTYSNANPDTPTLLGISEWGQYINGVIKLVFPGPLDTHLWIGGVKVTEEGCTTDAWQYDYEEKVLTLSGYEYEGEIPLINLTTYYGFGVIYYNGTEKLTINVTGVNTITVTSNEWGSGYGIETHNSDLEFAGDGSLTVTTANDCPDVRGVGFNQNAHTLTFGGSGSYNFNTRQVIFGSYSSSASVVFGEEVEFEATASDSVFYDVSSFVWARECAFWTNAAATEGRLCLKVGDELPEDFFYTIYQHFTYPYSSHTHNWSYTADGAKITASCATAECPITEGLTLELEAPANLTYDGAAKVATLKAGYSTVAFPNPEIKYYQAAAEVASCVNVGKYTAKVTFGSATAELKFTIAKADLNPAPEAVTDRNATYGQSLSEIALPDGWAWNAPTDKVGDVGTRQHKATFTPADASNYNTVEQNVNVIVAKADPAYTVPTGLTALINKTLSTVALPTGWAWDSPNENVGSETGNKTFKATFTPADTANYNVIEHVDITVLVTEHEHDWGYVASGAKITAFCSAAECPITEGLTLELEAPANLTYDGKAKAATLKAGYSADVFPSPEIKYYQGASEIAECVDAGSYAAKITFGGATASLDFVIAKATPTPAEVADRNATYGQSLSEIALPDGWAWNAPTDKVGDVGTRQHKATFTPADAANYNTVEQNVNVIVAKADPAYTVPTGLTALINKTLSTVALPTGWAWDYPNENVGSVVGNKVFKGTFTPADTANYNVIEHVDITVLVTEHEHDWGYVASGAKITASCSAAECPITEGLTLELEAPANLTYDGNAKAATLKEGYSPDAFPNPVIKYFSGNAEVSECVNVGSYIAKVTFGNAVAMVEFEILGKTMTDPDQPGVSVEIDDAVVEKNIELRVEVKTDVAEKETAADYEKIQKMLEANEQISKVYDVKLIRTVGGVETEIQPSDIKAGLKITVRMAIPEGVDMANARILHIHSVDDMEFVNDYETEGNDLVFEIGRLSQFAFVTKASAPAPGGDAGGSATHGFCIGWVALILDILAALAVGLYLILKLKPFKLPRKADEFGDKVTAKEVSLTLIACGALLANFLFGLVVLIVHQCPVSIVAFVLGLLLFVGIAFWYGWTRKQGKRTPLEDKIASKFKK